MEIRFNEKDVEGSNYIPEGETEVTVAEIKNDQSKAGNAMLVVTLKDRFGREAREFFSLGDNAKWKIAQFAMATGVTKESLLSQGLKFQSLMGKKLMMVKKQSGVVHKDGKDIKQYSQEFFQVKGAQGSTKTEDEIPF